MRFSNMDPTIRGSKKLSEFLKWQLNRRVTTWPRHVLNSMMPTLPQVIDSDEAYITFINHSTDLIQVAGLTVLTDPIFSKRAGPFSLIGPKRARPPGIKIGELPPIDIVLISHNHYDHMDMRSIRKIWKKHQPLFIVPLNNGKKLHTKGVYNIIELNWWQEYSLNKDQSIILTPAQHWSGRGLFDRCKTLWGGYIIKSKNMKIFFAGDTGYNNHFQEIRKRYGTMNVSILPIGAYEPRWFTHEQHMNPEEAVRAHIDLGSELSIGIHFGTFALTNEGIDDPIIELKKSLQLHHIPEKKFIAPEHGQTIIYTHCA